MTTVRPLTNSHQSLLLVTLNEPKKFNLYKNSFELRVYGAACPKALKVHQLSGILLYDISLSPARAATRS
jgi:hypothetical protein